MLKNLLVIFTFLFPLNLLANELISPLSFFQDAQYTNVKISPTGQYLAITYDEGNEGKLAVIDRQKSKVISAYGFGEFRVINQFYWASNERLVFDYYRSRGYLDNSRKERVLISTNADGSNRKELINVQSYNFQILDLLPNKEKKILIGAYDWRDKGKVKVREIDIVSNKAKVRYLNDQPRNANSVATDNQGSVRIAYGYEESSADEFGKGKNLFYYKKLNGDKWLTYQSDVFSKSSSLVFLGFDESNTEVFIASDHETKTQSVYKFNTEDNSLSKVLTHPNVDINSAIKGLNGAVVGAKFMPGVIKKVYFDHNNESVKLMKMLDNSFPGEHVSVTSTSEDNKLAIVSVRSDTNPGEYFLYDRNINKLSFIAQERPKINKAEMLPMKPIEIKSRDGKLLHGYLTLPKTANSKLPMIVNPHGGPHGPRDRWQFNPEVQFLANRGYAVLQINFRGSGGYGKEFLESGYRQWGRAMQDDLTDATLWAIEQKIADPERICIYGGSYGGYASLMGVVKEPKLYKCAIGYVGVYSLETMFTDGDIPKGSPGRPNMGIKFLKRVLGENETELKSNSPSENVSKIEAALFIAHGKNDVRVPMAQYHALTNALDNQGIKYESMLKDEGHGYSLEHNKIEFYTAIEKFLNKHIGIQSDGQ